jgi:hypothetical protein
MMSDYRPDALIQLCRALLPEDASLAEEVALASSDAAAYYARFQQQLMEDRGIDPEDIPFPDLPWLALLDGLRYRQHLDEFDWRARAADVMMGVDTLLHDPETAALSHRAGYRSCSAWRDCPATAISSLWLRPSLRIFNSRGRLGRNRCHSL